MTLIHIPSENQTDPFAMPRPSATPTSGLDKNQKKMLGISAAALLLGGSAWAIVQKTKNLPNNPADPNEAPTGGSESSILLPDDIDVAGKVTDKMSFEQAFEAARKEVGLGGVFSWHGRWYNTFEKEEWRSLSLEQRQEFTEMVAQEHLPVKPFATVSTPIEVANVSTEPTLIEGHLNGQRIMGLDFDHDGVIDTVVMDGADGYTYRIVDATGDEGLDTFYRYDALNGELVEIEKLDNPFVLSNDQFSQGLEESMSKEIVDSILDDGTSDTDSVMAVDETIDEPDAADDQGFSDSYDTDDTYINDGNVADMDE
ncbi:hypothetical protein WBJ53_02285 [Spirosoma sp. SC4-14]|uniref:hypothetical protein n=1 Tax=Spirosoma sp. SC4-14 TaxID=3128900 RepID=UPI0030D5A3DE